MKRGEKGLIKPWLQRWFVACENNVIYKKQANDEFPLAEINLKDITLITIDLSKDNEQTFLFGLAVTNRVYALHAMHHEDRTKWILYFLHYITEDSKVIKYIPSKGGSIQMTKRDFLANSLLFRIFRIV